MITTRRKFNAGSIILAVAIVGGIVASKQFKPTSVSIPTDRPLAPEIRSRYATWPLPGAKQDAPHAGVTHWFATDPSDGTTVDVFDFDFGANPRLRWQIFDQDEDDAKPFDNHVDYWTRNVAAATQQFNRDGQGEVVAAWNGAFFGYYQPSGTAGGFHVSPVVLRGKAYYTDRNHRWTFGVKYAAGRPVWKVLFLPDKAQLEREFDYAAGSLQCLVKDGKPLKMEAYPHFRSQIKGQPVPSTPLDAGHIPLFDHMRTCRTSMAWSQDNRHLYLLVVKETDNEGSSSAALTTNQPLAGGWMVSDVQRFWLARKVWGAVNSDAGGVAQLVYRNPDQHYTMVPPQLASGSMRIQCGPQWQGAATRGGSIMYFNVRETGRK